MSFLETREQSLAFSSFKENPVQWSEMAHRHSVSAGSVWKRGRDIHTHKAPTSSLRKPDPELCGEKC